MFDNETSKNPKMRTSESLIYIKFEENCYFKIIIKGFVNIHFDDLGFERTK